MRPLLSMTFACALAAGGCGAAAPGPDEPTNAGGVIAGVASDTHTELPISFVTVEATGKTGTAEATTGARGEFELALPPGSYKVVARFRDHELVFTNVPVKKGERTTVNVSIASMDVPEFRVSSWDPNATWGHGHGGHTAHAPDPTVTDGAATHAVDTSAKAQARNHHVAGLIRGIVRDQASKESLAGAVVSATAPHLRNALMAMSDDDGKYALLGLRPGKYTLSVYYHLVDRGNMEVRRTNVAVVAGKTTKIDLELDAISDQ